MSTKTWKFIGVGLSVLGAVVSLAASAVSDKLLDAKVEAAANKAVANALNSKGES